MQLAITNTYLKSAWEWIVWAWKAFRASVTAFLTSPQVWFAAAVFAFIGYYGGYLLGVRHVPVLKADIKVLEKSVEKLTDSNRVLAAANEALKKQLETKASTAEPAPVKAAPVAKRKAPAAAPVKAWWLP